MTQNMKTGQACDAHASAYASALTSGGDHVLAQGYEASGAAEGVCTARWLEREQVAVAEYTGQAVTCEPERNADGTMAESFCRLEQTEAIL